MATQAASVHHFVLVHGLAHGAWCWYKLRCLLEKSGHRVSALDLAGSGIDMSDPNSISTLDQYDRPLIDHLSGLPEGEKVILVGHSAGGLSVTHAMYQCGDRIKLVVYIAAGMLRSGFSTKQDIKDGTPDLSEYGEVSDLYFGLGYDKPPTSSMIRREFQRELLYHLSPEEDATLASMLLRPGPTRPMRTARFEDDDGNIDRIKRVYIKTLCDRMLKIEQQEHMIKRWPPNMVLAVESDHSAFFSATNKLFDLLMHASTITREAC